MPVGLEVRNSDGILQIDGTYRSWTLAEKRTLTTDGSAYAVSLCRSRTVDYTGRYPLFAVKPLEAFCTVAIPMLVGTNTWRTDITFSGTDNRTFDLFIFDIMDAQTGPGFGIQVFNESGAIVFDGTKPQMRFLDVINTLDAPKLVKDYSGPFLVVQAGFYFEADSWSGGGYDMQIDSFRAVGNRLELGGPTYDVIGYNEGYGDRNYLIIDASGLP